MRVTGNLLLLLASIVFLVLFTVMGFGWWEVDHPFGWLGLGLATFAASFIQWGTRSSA